MTEEEVIANVIVTMVGGQETTTNLIGNGLLTLLRRPEQLRRLRDTPELMESGVEELLRYESPSQHTARIAPADAVLGGIEIPEGDAVIAVMGAGNRDPGAIRRPRPASISSDPTIATSRSGGRGISASERRWRGSRASSPSSCLLARFPDLALVEGRADQLAAEPRPAGLDRLAGAARVIEMPVAAPPGPAPLSVAQEALWYQGVLHPQDIIYNECVSFRHEGPLDVAALEQALEEIIRRHEVWRTTFARVDGAPVQLVQACPAIRLAELDLSGLPEAEAERTASRIMGDVARVPYDLRTGPLLRPRLLRFAGDRQRLYLAMHHIIFDGVSIYRTVLPELAVLYEAFAAGRPSPLPPPAVQYGQFAAWQQQQIDGPRLQRRLAWWQQQLADVPPLTLPTDRPPRPEITELSRRGSKAGTWLNPPSPGCASSPVITAPRCSRPWARSGRSC